MARKQVQVRKKVIGYLRVSTEGQVKDGESLPRQREQIEAYAKLHGLETDLEFISDEGYSGFKSSRPGFQKLIGLCSKKQASMVIVYDLSRLSRSVLHTLQFVEETIAPNGIEFVSLQNSIDTSTPMGKAFLTISACFNQLYRDEVSFKTKLALAHKKQKGEKTGGVVPFGYRLVEGTYLVPDRAEIEVIRVMHRMRKAGLTLREIVEELQNRGFKTKTGKSRWSHKVVRTILEKQIHLINHSSELSCSDKHEALIDVLDARYALEEREEQQPQRLKKVR